MDSSRTSTHSSMSSVAVTVTVAIAFMEMDTGDELSVKSEADAVNGRAVTPG